MYFHFQAQLTNDSAIPLTPPLTGISLVNFSTATIELMNATISSIHLAGSAKMNDVQTFNLSLTNVAGVTHSESSIRGKLESDTSNICLN